MQHTNVKGLLPAASQDTQSSGQCNKLPLVFLGCCFKSDHWGACIPRTIAHHVAVEALPSAVRPSLRTASLKRHDPDLRLGAIES